MSEARVRRRGHGEDAIYLRRARNRYVGAVSLGYGPDGKRIRRKVSGKTKQEVRDKLKALHAEIGRGSQDVEQLHGAARRSRTGCARAWTARPSGPGPSTRACWSRCWRHRGPAAADLSAGDVRSALSQLAARYSTRSLQITRNSLERAIRHAEANDLVGRNVAALVKAPRGRGGRPSKSFTLEQAKALLAAAEGTRLHAYVALSLLAGIRTEEARALRWDHVVTWVEISPAGSPSPRRVRGRLGRARTGSRSTCGVRSGRAATPRPRSRGGPWRCRSACVEALREHRSSRSGTG